MSISTEEFQELINAEVIVDMNKLRNAASHGIPEEIRGQVWLFLLGVKTPDKSNELSLAEARRLDYLALPKDSSEYGKRLRLDIQRYFKSRDSVSKLSATVENVVLAYLGTHKQLVYDRSMVYLCGPFSRALNDEYEIYFCFEKLMELLNEEEIPMLTINQKVSHFFMLFRSILPDLYNHFEEEDVDFREWSHSWLTYLLAKELPMDCVMRLWDMYFSLDSDVQILEMHEYTCLAILDSQKEDLEESEQSQIHAHLLRLPYLDMDQIISRAKNLLGQFSNRD